MNTNKTKIRLVKRLLILLCWFPLVSYAQELKTDTASGLNFIVRESTEEAVTVIMIHGYGSNEKDLYSYANFFPGTNFYCLQGPLVYSATSFSWYDITWHKNGTKTRDIRQALNSVEQIAQFVRGIKNQSKGKVVLGGFSQGAILSLKTAMTYPELLDGIICFGGMPLDTNMGPDMSKRKDYEALVAFYGHGSADPTLSIEQGRKCKEILEQANMKTTYKEYPGVKHQISSEELQDAIKWFQSQFLK